MIGRRRTGIGTGLGTGIGTGIGVGLVTTVAVVMAVVPGVVSAAPQESMTNPRGRPATPLRSPLTEDPRSTILLRYDCESEVGRRDVTLFGDGTIRLRRRVAATETGHGPAEGVLRGGGEQSMRLYELDPDSLDAYRARLGDIDLSEVEVERSPVGGEWIERCVLDVLREESTPSERSFRFSRYSALPLELSRLVRIAEDLITEADERAGRGLPSEYEPRPGDVLERLDGVRFEVVAYTVDGNGVELIGIDAPLVLYLSRDGLRQRFSRVVSRGEGADGGGGP